MHAQASSSVGMHQGWRKLKTYDMSAGNVHSRVCSRVLTAPAWEVFSWDWHQSRMDTLRASQMKILSSVDRLLCPACCMRLLWLSGATVRPQSHTMCCASSIFFGLQNARQSYWIIAAASIGAVVVRSVTLTFKRRRAYRLADCERQQTIFYICKLIMLVHGVVLISHGGLDVPLTPVVDQGWKWWFDDLLMIMR